MTVVGEGQPKNIGKPEIECDLQITIYSSQIAMIEIWSFKNS